MARVILPQKNLTLEAPDGENLMTFLQNNDIPVASSCLGDGICSMCRMQLKVLTTTEGPVRTLAQASEFELNSLARNKCEPNERLSCQVTITADIEVRTKYW